MENKTAVEILHKAVIEKEAGFIEDTKDRFKGVALNHYNKKEQEYLNGPKENLDKAKKYGKKASKIENEFSRKAEKFKSNPKKARYYKDKINKSMFGDTFDSVNREDFDRFLKNKEDTKMENKTALEMLQEAAIEKEALYDNLKTTKQDRKDSSKYVNSLLFKSIKDKGARKEYKELNKIYRDEFAKNRGGIKDRAKEAVPAVAGTGLAIKGFRDMSLGLSPKRSKALIGTGAVLSMGGVINSDIKNYKTADKARVNAYKQMMENKKEKTAFDILDEAVIEKEAGIKQAAKNFSHKVSGKNIKEAEKGLTEAITRRNTAISQGFGDIFGETGAKIKQDKLKGAKAETLKSRMQLGAGIGAGIGAGAVVMKNKKNNNEEKTAFDILDEAVMEKEALAIGAVGQAVKGVTTGVKNFGGKVLGKNVKQAEKKLATQTNYFENLNKNMKFPEGARGDKMKANMNSNAEKVLGGSQQKVNDAIADTSKARKQLGVGIGVAGAVGLGANAIKNSNNNEEKTAFEELDALVLTKQAELETEKEEKVDEKALNKVVEQVSTSPAQTEKKEVKKDEKKEVKKDETADEKKEKEDKKDEEKDTSKEDNSDNTPEKTASADFSKPTFESDLIKTAQELHGNTEYVEPDSRKIDNMFTNLINNMKW